MAKENQNPEVKKIGNPVEAARFAADLAAMIQTRTEDKREITTILHVMAGALINPYATLLDASILTGQYLGLVERRR